MKIATRITAENQENSCHKLVDIHKPVIVYCHGNAEDIGSGQFGCQAFCTFIAKECNCVVVSFDYPGYGQSCDIKPNEKNICEAIDVVLEYVEKVLLAQNVFLYGKSIGSVPALYAASKSEKKYKGLFLHSPLATAARVTFFRNVLPNFLLSNYCDHLYLDNLSRIKKVTCPTAIIHGKQDEIIDYHNSIELWKACPHKFENLVLVGTNSFKALHNNIEYEYSTNLLDLLQHLLSQNSDVNKRDI